MGVGQISAMNLPKVFGDEKRPKDNQTLVWAFLFLPGKFVSVLGNWNPNHSVNIKIDGKW